MRNCAGRWSGDGRTELSLVLIADDSPKSRELLRAVLESGGHEVVEACDGGQALEQLRGMRPDLVVLDIQMPVLDGFSTVAEIRRMEEFRSLPVVALSAHAMECDRERAISSGFTHYLSKPIPLSALRRELERFLK